MKVYIYKNLKKRLIYIALTAMLAISCLMSGIVFAHAQNPSQATLSQVLPQSNLEYYELSSPIDVYSDAVVTAILQDQKLILYTNGEYSEIVNDADNQLVSAKQIKKFTENSLLISSGSLLRAVNVNDHSITPITANNMPVGCNYFDLNDKYIVTASSTSGVIYTLDGTNIINSDITTLREKLSDDCPIAINNNNEIFYVANGELCKRSIDDLSEIKILASVTPSKMIANNEFVYYLEDDEVFRISVNGGVPEKLIVLKDQKHDLGNLIKPNSLSFKGQNLLVTDNYLNAVQEFALRGSGLDFTGFAIAKGKTAYNRISSTVKEIERYDKTLAVLDSNKLSVITVDGSFTSYNKQSFKHYFSSDLGYAMPDGFALGTNSVLSIYNQNNSSSTLRTLNLKDGTLSDPMTIFEGNIVRDVCFQSGKYYVLTDNGNGKSLVYSLVEGETSFTPLLTSLEVYGNAFTVDVYGNVYLAEDYVYKITKTDSGYTAPEQLTTLSGIKKLSTDLGDGLFALTSNSIYSLGVDGNWTSTNLANGNFNNLQSFAMSFDRKQVYLVYQGEELIFSTGDLSNFAVNQIQIPSDFIISDKNADIDDFKAFKGADNTNVYSVKKDLTNQYFEFSALVDSDSDYALVCNVTLDDGNGRTLSLYALVGQTETVLIDQKTAVEVTPIIHSEAPTKAFITTTVHGYYLPIITPNDLYVISDTENIRIPKETVISPTKQFTFLQKDYYFAQVTVNGVNYSCYVPIDFTVEVLAQDFAWDSYLLERVYSTQVYKEKELQNSLTTLDDNVAVRLIENQGNVCKIAFLSQDGWVIGYINTASIKNDAGIAVRNILIILTVTASICATSIYFVLKKKS